MVPQEELLKLTTVYEQRTAAQTHAIVTQAIELRATRGMRGRGDELLKENSLYPIEVSFQSYLIEMGMNPWIECILEDIKHRSP
jgi:hypothetical protein